MENKLNSWLILLLCVICFSSIAQQTIENNRICLDPIAGTGAYIGTAPSGGVCLLCGTGGANNVVNGNLDDFAVANLTVGLLAGTNVIIVKDSLQYYPAGNEAGFIIAPNSGILTANLLSHLRIETYRNGTFSESAIVGGGGGNSLLSLSVLQGANNGKQIISFTTTQDFDEIRLVSIGTISALTSFRIYEAFEGPANCAHDCTDALTGAGITVTTGQSGTLCIGGGITNESLVVDADTATNFGNIAVPLVGVNCTKFIQVNSTTTYPAYSFAGFTISDNSGLLGVNLLGGITISTYLGGTLRETVSGSSLLSALAISGGSGIYQVGFRTTQSYDRIRITVSGLVSLSLGADYNIYYAFVKYDTDQDGVPDCLDKCSSGSDLEDADGDGTPDACDNNTIDISLAKAVNNATPAQGANVTFVVTATRDNTTLNATGLKIKDLLPSGFTYQSHSSPVGTFYNQTTGIWNIGSALAGNTTNLSLSIVARADSVGVLSNVAEIIAANETDLDSPYNNGLATEDDIASACVSVPVQICQGQSLTLTAPASAPSYQWYRNDVLIPGATNQEYVATESGNYTVNFTSTTGCVAGNCCPVIVNVNTLPALSAGSDVATCRGTAVNLTATGTGTLLWNTGETTATISVNPASSLQYTVSLTSALGCVSRDTVIVTVRPTPTSANAVALCNNAGTPSNGADDTFTITLNPSGGSGSGFTYTVFVNGTSTGQTYNYGSASTPINAGLISSGQKTLRIVDVNGCELSTTVNPPASCSSCPTKVCVPIVITKS